MIDVALGFVKLSLDQYLINTFDLGSSAVVLNSLVDSNGAPSQLNQNKVVITLINLELETNKQFSSAHTRHNNLIAQHNPPVHFNLDILISSNFDDYAETLKFLTAVIAFFQANPTLNRSDHPSLPDGISALKFEIENSNYGKAFELWGALGAKYQPSIIYKIRHVTVQSGEVKKSTAAMQNF